MRRCGPSDLRPAANQPSQGCVNTGLISKGSASVIRA